MYVLHTMYVYNFMRNRFLPNFAKRSKFKVFTVNRHHRNAISNISKYKSNGMTTVFLKYWFFALQVISLYIFQN